jgi:fatty acid desaturase
VLTPIYYLGFIKGIFQYVLYFYIYGLGAFFLSTVPHMLQDKLAIHKNEEFWSYQVVKNTCDYMIDSDIVYQLSGGFNIHCLHHLLPGIHGSHLSKVYPLFIEICNKHNYPYKNVTSFKELFSKQFLFLKQFSVPSIIEKKEH